LGSFGRASGASTGPLGRRPAPRARALTGSLAVRWAILGTAGESDRRAERPAPAGDPSNLNRVIPAEGAMPNRELTEALESGTVTWGIRPVPDDQRPLRARDLAVLWGDLSIGLLVLVSGALLVPAVGL